MHAFPLCPLQGRCRDCEIFIFMYFNGFYRVPVTIAALTVASIILTCCLIVVMANEFPILPDKLIRWSDTFSLCWKDRSIFVVFVITTIALATGLAMVSGLQYCNKSFFSLLLEPFCQRDFASCKKPTLSPKRISFKHTFQDLRITRFVTLLTQNCSLIGDFRCVVVFTLLNILSLLYY